MNWVLTQLSKIKYTPTLDDLPEVLDHISKNCLLLEYQNICEKEEKRNQQIKLPSLNGRNRVSSNLEMIAKRSQLRDVYLGAK